MSKETKPMKIVIVEHMGTNYAWEWYDVARNTTPEEQINFYLETMDMEKGEIKQESDGCFYSKDENVRARYYEI